MPKRPTPREGRLIGGIRPRSVHAVPARRALLGLLRAPVAVGLVLSLTPRPALAQVPGQDCDIEESGTMDESGRPLYEGGDPRRQLQKVRPFRIAKYPCIRSPEYRAIRLKPDRLELVEGGRLVRRIPFGAAGRPVPLDRVARAVGDRRWLAEVDPGVFEVSAALVQDPGTDLTVAAPRVRAVRLLDRPGVFVGGQRSKARFEGVSVTSWNAERRAPVQEAVGGRPFVLYENGSRLEIVRSELAFLGSDRTTAYGVTWRTGTTGEALESTFAGNFFGVYTFEARDIVFRRNVFRKNVLYGFDPHDATSGLVVEDNEAHENGSHGFIVSRYVVDSVFRGNRSHDNAGNGMVMDFHSDRNRLEGNVVERNTKDGIVLLGSAHNAVVGNVVRNNRVGIRVNNPGSGSNEIRDNLVEGNDVGLQAYGGAADLVVAGNRVYRTKGTAMVLESPRSVVTSGEIRGASVGVSIRTATTVSDLAVSEVARGVVVDATGIARLERLDVRATEEALRVKPEALVDVVDSKLLPPPPPVAGQDPPDRRWLPLAGIGALALAVVLELLRRLRERRDAPVPSPPGVWNTT